jgi:membrane protease YdiL (CAAX protease family)
MNDLTGFDPREMGWRRSFVFFCIPTILLYIATHVVIPILHTYTGLPILVCWYISGLLLVFLPLFIAALVLFRLEGNEWNWVSIRERFRLESPSLRTCGFSILGLISVGLLTYVLIEAGKSVIPGFSASPDFMIMEPLRPGEYWVLYAWIPLFIFNILGEGLFWRGYIFPLQQKAFGKYTWLVHGGFWTMFHIPFGINLVITLVPIIFIISYVVQKTNSSWPDVIIHAIINGTGFLLVAFGIVT